MRMTKFLITFCILEVDWSVLLDILSNYLDRVIYFQIHVYTWLCCALIWGGHIIRSHGIHRTAYSLTWIRAVSETLGGEVIVKNLDKNGLYQSMTKHNKAQIACTFFMYSIMKGSGEQRVSFKYDLKMQFKSTWLFLLEIFWTHFTTKYSTLECREISPDIWNERKNIEMKQI